MTGKQRQLVEQWTKALTRLEAFTEYAGLGTSVAAAEDVVILRKAACIIARHITRLDPAAGWAK